MSTAGKNVTARSKPRKSGMTIWLLIAILLTKGKAVFALLLKAKGLSTALSAVVSILVYWWTANLGLAGATGLIGLLFIHEMGHVLACRYYGVPASAPMFIPFLGALITMKRHPKNVKEEAVIALGGPVLGSVGAVLCLGVYHVYHSPLWLWLASVGFMLNLFNLIPLSPLDGGRIAGAIWRGFWFIGLAAILVMAIVTQSAFFMLILAIGIGEINSRYLKFHRYVWYALGVIGALTALGLLGEYLYTNGWHGVLVILEDIGIVAVIAIGAVLLLFLLVPVLSYVKTKVGQARQQLEEEKAEDTKDATPEVEDADEAEEQPGPLPEQYFEIPLWQRVAIGLVYLGLAAALTYGILWTHATGVLK